MDLGLKDKVVLVAAASKGLGRAVALEFAREGAQVAICSRDKANVTSAAEEIARTTGTKVVGITADVGTGEGCETFVRTAQGAFGGIDALVVNAGGPPPGRFDELDDAAWQKAIEITLFSAVRLTRLALPSLRARGGGSILYMTSSTVRQPTQHLNLILSTSIRSAVQGMAKALSADLAKDGIRVNALQPGRISTERLASLDEDRARRTGKTLEEIRAEFEEAVPMGRSGQPNEFAAAAVFPSSGRASYITGQSLLVDGGMVKG